MKASQKKSDSGLKLKISWKEGSCKIWGQMWGFLREEGTMGMCNTCWISYVFDLIRIRSNADSIECVIAH